MDLIGNEIADKLTSVSTKLHPKFLEHAKNDDAYNETKVPNKDAYLKNKGNKLLIN